MWTNVFRIRELHQVSYFQFLPLESDTTSLSEASLKEEQNHVATLSVLSAHLKLLSEGFLTTWTNSFVGPWDPSQGVHNPDEKIKLWLFLPGRYTSVIESAKPSLLKLKVVGSGVWLSPGDSEEVGFALAQALRNRIERSLRSHSYLRFGDVFTKCHAFSQLDKNFRGLQPILEFVFSATEEAIYVHAIVSARTVRGFSTTDLEGALKHCSSKGIKEGLPVVVAPYGMRGRFTGCTPCDLVKQVYSRFSGNASSDFNILRVPAQPNGCIPGEECYVEVTMGGSSMGVSGKMKLMSSANDNASQQLKTEHTVLADDSAHLKNPPSGPVRVGERTFIFPPEAVLVPLLHRTFAKSSLGRFWIQTSSRIYGFDAPSLWNQSGSSFIRNCLGFGSTGDIKFLDGLLVESSCIHSLQKYNSRSNSNSSSISSWSSTSSDSDNTMASGAQELEADADSVDGSKLVSKRPRSVTAESFVQAGTPASGHNQDQLVSEYNMAEGSNQVTVGQSFNHTGSGWNWDEDRGTGLDIQALLVDFGDFGDFFKDDLLPIGEPPGTVESQLLLPSGPDYGNIIESPSAGRTDPNDQALLPTLSFNPYEDFSQLPPSVNMDQFNRIPEFVQYTSDTSGAEYPSLSSSTMHETVTKAESMMTLAAEYSAVEAPMLELATSIFRNPYVPKSKRVVSPPLWFSASMYSAEPPFPQSIPSEVKSEILSSSKPEDCCMDMTSPNQTLKCYSLVVGKENTGRKTSLTDIKKEDPPSSVVTDNSQGVPATAPRKMSETSVEASNFLISSNTVLATELECCLFQASMCRVRHHTFLTCNRQDILSASRSTGVSEQIYGDPNATANAIPSRYEVRKEQMALPMVGEADGLLDRHITTAVGVWRSVGASKSSKSLTHFGSEPHSNNVFIGDGSTLNGHRQPLLQLLDALPLLVQQSVSFVDMSMDDEDGPYQFLTLQEQTRRGFGCGPSMVHAGCGGILASCHSVDIAGIGLFNPLSADVHASTVISLLQSDVKLALKNAFDRNVDGPLSVTDWCKGQGLLGNGDLLSAESNAIEAKDLTFSGDPISPSTSAVTSSFKDGSRIDEPSHRRTNPELEQHMTGFHLGQTITVLPLPSLLVGYQDDWLKTSVNSLNLWEKAPFEPYASPKPMAYYALCPNIEILKSCATDFLLQLGTVYEACKLGSHSPHPNSSQSDIGPDKINSSGIVLVDCPQSLKAGSSDVICGSISDYLDMISKDWDVKSFLQALTRSLRSLSFSSLSSANQKEGSNMPCTVIYVICPFPDPVAVLQTLVEASAVIGSMSCSSDREQRSLLNLQVTKALSLATDEAIASNVPMLSGFSIPKVVLQTVSLEFLLRNCRPSDDLAIMKEFAFTLYNKARRIPLPTISGFTNQSSSGRSQNTLMPMSSPPATIWKDSLVSRISASNLTREAEVESSLRSGTWDNSWQTMRTGGMNCDPVRSTDLFLSDDLKYSFEPLFILAEPGSGEPIISAVSSCSATSESSNSRCIIDDNSAYLQNSVSGGVSDMASSPLLDGSEHERRAPSIHCCYGWTEDWRWLICIWTDSRGELLDSQIFPFGGISTRQDTKLLQCLFVQILNQACLILSSIPSDSVTARFRDVIITRIGCFFELECQEWQKAINTVGGNEVKKWSLQLRRAAPGIFSTSNGASLQQQDVGLIQERMPSSPSPSMYSPHAKSSSYIKNSLGQPSAKKTLSAGQLLDSSRGPFQYVRSISLISVSVDHSLHLVLPADATSSGGGTQTSGGTMFSGYLEGFTPVKSLGGTPTSFLFIPSPCMRYIPPNPMQLPTCLTSESPPLAHLLHSKGSAIPFSTGYVVSKAVSCARQDLPENMNAEWPSTLSVSLIDHYGSYINHFQEKVTRSSGNASSGKQSRNLGLEANTRDHEAETHMILESIAADLHSLSWMTVSPSYPDRRTPLPFHCDNLLRLRRLLHYADRQLSQVPEH